MAIFLFQIQAKIFLLLVTMLLYNYILIVLEGAASNLCHPVYLLWKANFVCYNMVWSKLQSGAC